MLTYLASWYMYVGELMHHTIGRRGNCNLCIFGSPYNLGGLLAEGFSLIAMFLGMSSFFSRSLISCSTLLSIAKWVVNLYSLVLTEAEEYVLHRGLNFATAPRIGLR